jgi:DNA-binding winged helix-turn-helix (wHTH) protein
MLYRFGHYELDEEMLTLRRGPAVDGYAGEILALEPKPFAVLLHLLRRHPVLVDNQELLDTVWPDVVVTRSSLARAVRALRRALGEEANGRSVIRTERGRGYGIAVPVEREAGAALPSALALRGSGRARARPSPLVGRAAPLAALSDLLVRAAAGRGRVATVVGEPGIGKTRLAEALLEAASLAGWIPLVGRCADEGQAPPLWPWMQVLRAAGEAFPRDVVSLAMGSGAADLLALAPELPGHSGDPPEPSNPLEEGAQQFRLLEAVDRFLAALAHHRPLLVWIDDLHSADASSLALFGHLARNASGRALALLASHRPVELDAETPIAELLRRLAALPHAHPPIRLAGLAADDLAVVAEAEAGFALAADQRLELHTHTGGNPFFAIELVRAGAIRPRAGDAMTAGIEGVPERIRAVVRERVEKLPAAAQALLRMAAVAGRDASLPLLARALDLAEAELLDPLEQLERAELLREDSRHPGAFAFVHALVPEALVEAMPPSFRVRAHANVARALEALSAHAPDSHLASLAHHFGEAAAGGELAKAVEYASRAGDQARARRAFAEAAALYRRAIDWETASRERSDRTLAGLFTALARAEVARGDPAAAARASFQALACAEAAGSPALVAEAAWPLAGSQYRGPGAERVVAALEAALADVGEHDPRSEALLAAALARSLLFSGDFDRSDALSARAVALARRARDPALELRALSTRDLVLTNDPRYAERAVVSRDRVGLAMELGVRSEEVLARLRRAVRLIEEIDPEGVDREIEECQRLVETLHGEPRFPAWIADLQCLRAIWQGRIEEAVALLPRVRSLWEQVDPPYGMMSVGAKETLIDRLTGRLAEPGSGELEGARGPLRYALPKPYHCSLALRLHESGRDAEARETFEFLSRRDYADLRQDSTFLISAVMLAELAYRLDDRYRAAQLARLLAPFAGRYAVGFSVAVLGAVDRYRGLIAWTLGDLAAADALLAGAVAAEQRMGAPAWQAIVHVDRARLRLERGGPDAEASARAELEAADACCAGLEVPGIRALVAGTGSRLGSHG